ncbi:SNARE domain [Carpediemonas membranifera]|uniref:SNARE domain n=1 Tax=Carpediemonas membranifera TaxID=201153 RepID=A0A8J6B4M1_9EUKA|nr:SNARE domain [Carpediemonas membranifera]|eukprot:KAG9394219.1 SNARE domain [Carpediemonas membranifera]
MASYKTTRELSEKLVDLVRQKTAAENEQVASQFRLKLRTQSKSLDPQIKLLNADLQKMRRNPVVYRLTRADIQERMKLMDILKKQQELIAVGINPTRQKPAHSQNTNPLFEYKETSTTQGANNMELMEIQREIMEVKHGAKLDQISQHMTDLKEIGVTIGDELDEGDEIIDTLDSNMTATTNRLKAAARRVEKTRKKVRIGWKMLCLNTCAFVLMLVLAVTVFIPNDGILNEHEASDVPAAATSLLRLMMPVNLDD